VQFEYVSEEMKDIFKITDIALSRAGANAICELLALRIPNVLIPLSAKASRGDQILNAISMGDATNFTWEGEIDAVVFEGYLGTPMSKPPVDIKFKTEKAKCKEIAMGFLKNITPQIKSGTPVVMALPAWLRENGKYAGLNILDEIQEMGYNFEKFQDLSQSDLLYYREGQIVAREIIVIRKR